MHALLNRDVFKHESECLVTCNWNSCGRQWRTVACVQRANCVNVIRTHVGLAWYSDGQFIISPLPMAYCCRRSVMFMCVIPLFSCIRLSQCVTLPLPGPPGIET